MTLGDTEGAEGGERGGYDSVQLRFKNILTSLGLPSFWEKVVLTAKPVGFLGMDYLSWTWIFLSRWLATVPSLPS